MTFLHRFVLLYCLDTFWQIPLLYSAAYLSDNLLPHSSAVFRHRLWLGTFLLCLVMPVVSASGYPRAYLEHTLLQTRQVSQSESAAIVARADVAFSYANEPRLSIPDLTVANVLLGLWIISVLFRNGQIIWAYRRIRLIISTADLVQIEDLGTAALFAGDAASGGALKVLISEKIGMPAAAGLRRPVVLLPKALVSAAKSTDLDAVLAHEQAHIVRHDFLWNLALQILASPMDYNPATRLLLGKVSETRELICDRMAAGQTGGTALYAQTLVRISELLLKPAISNAPAPGLFDGQSLETRVMSLLDLKPRSKRRWTAAMAFLSVSIVTPCCLAAAGLVYEPPALVASDLQPYTGTWHWMFKGKPFVTMQLVVERDHLAGYMTNGFFSYDNDGNMTDAGSHPGKSAIVRTFFAGNTLHIVVQDDQDKSLSEWTMTLKGVKTAEFTTADPEAPKNFKPWIAERSTN